MIKKFGFTLVELLVVISIISLLSSVVFATINSARAKARDVRRVADLRQLRLALELYFDANGDYPPVTGGIGDNMADNCFLDYGREEFSSVLNSLITSGFIVRIPDDPLGYWPYCFFYQKPASYSHCPTASNYPYLLIFATEVFTFNSFVEYDIVGENGSKRRYCIYP